MRDFIVKIARKLGLYKAIVSLINDLKFRIQARRMKKDGLRMLKAADEAVGGSGVRPFLIFGSLLGAYRDHGFISYDPDIDLAVVDDGTLPDMAALLGRNGFELIRQIYFRDDNTMLEETYRYGKLQLDIFRMFPVGDDLYVYCARRHEFKDWKEANASDGFPCVHYHVPNCEFHRQDFLGLKVYMPDLTDRWLRDIFSDTYMTPIRNYKPEDHVTTMQKTDRRCYRRLDF